MPPKTNPLFAPLRPGHAAGDRPLRVPPRQYVGVDEREEGLANHPLMTQQNCCRCIQLIIGTYIIYHVWLFFSSFSGSDPAPVPPPPPRAYPGGYATALCDVPVEAYRTTGYIIDQCSVRTQWNSLAAISRANEGGCHWNESTNEIFCSRASSCQGGHRRVHSWSTLHSNLSLDCGICPDTLRVNCCKSCESVSRQNLDYEYINCLGCEHDTLQTIVNRSEAICSRDRSGYFSCETRDTCHVPAHVTSANISHSWNCAITPCDACINSQLHAKCCSLCLADLCGHPTDRQACIGCNSSELSRVQTSLHMLQQL